MQCRNLSDDESCGEGRLGSNDTESMMTRIDELSGELQGIVRAGGDLLDSIKNNNN